MCKWPECGSQHHARGLCTRHYQRAKAMGDFTSPWETWDAPRKCPQCGSDFRLVRSDAQYCSARCSVASYDSRNRGAALERAALHKSTYPERHRLKEQRRRAQKAETTVEYFTESDIRALHGDDCGLCGLAIDYSLRWPEPGSPSVDHVIPLAKGGTHTLGNVVMAHLSCNIRKGSTILDRETILQKNQLLAIPVG